MISDTQLNSIAIFLGTLMMGLIVLYHFLSVNASESAEKVGKGVKSVHAGLAGRAGAVGMK
ncbi:Oligosaccaryltransferase-domain-containing protein [Tuber brumale]|nr:Oligosaccaryltransferase-domain-containing protein [Tuber brumale]